VSSRAAWRDAQKSDISKAREFDRRTEKAPPQAITEAAFASGCRSVAFQMRQGFVASGCESKSAFKKSEIPEKIRRPNTAQMSPPKGKKGAGRGAIPSSLSPNAESDIMTLRQVADYLAVRLQHGLSKGARCCYVIRVIEFHRRLADFSVARLRPRSGSL